METDFLLELAAPSGRNRAACVLTAGDADTVSGLQDEQAAVRSSAVMAVAECVSALGPRCLPHLGPILDTVLQAAEAALASIPADAPSAAAPKVCQSGSSRAVPVAEDARS